MGDDGSVWIRELGSLVAHGGPGGTLLPQKEYDEVVCRIIQSIQESHVTLLEVLKPLGAYLEMEDDVPRCRAVSFLAELLVQAPGMMTGGDVHFVAEFFTSKLMDWPALHGALVGCRAVVDHVGEEDAVALLQTLQDGVYVRSLSVKDRQLALKIIDRIVLRYGKQALDADIDLAELVVVSIDGEKDPRCLLAGFDVATHVMMLFASLDSDSVHVEYMENACEEMFDILSCYFPVSFTPSNDDESSITRDDLARGLQATLLAWPGFYTCVLDLIEEKMSSVMKQAKRDSLCLLMGLSEVDSRAVGLESRRIWNMLRPQLMMAFYDGKEYAPSFQSAQDIGIGDDALKCLARCLQACNSTDACGRKNALVGQVVSDVAIDDALTCLEHGAWEEEDAFIRAVASVRSSCVILKACSMAEGEAAMEAMNAVGDTLFQCLDKQSPPVCEQAACLGHLLLHSLVVGGSSFVCNDGKMMIGKILDRALEFSDYDMHIVGDHDKTGWNGNEFMWPSDMSVYSTATLLLTKLHICHTLVVQKCDVWTKDRIDRLVDGLVQYLLQVHTHDVAIAERILVDACVASILSPLECMNIMLNRVEDGDCTQVERVFHVVAQLCMAEPSLRHQAFQWIQKHMITGIPHAMMKALSIVEDALEQEDGCDPAEIDILHSMLMASSSGQSGDATEDMVTTCFNICRKASSSEQEELIMKDTSIFVNLDEKPLASRYSAIGVLLGLEKQSVIFMMENTSIVDQLLRSSQQNDSSKWYQMCLASLLNKCIPEKNDIVEGVLDTILSNALQSSNDGMDWTCLRACCKAVAKCGGNLEKILMELCCNVNERHHTNALLHALLTESPEDVWIQTTSHAQVTFLWQQRTYVAAKSILLSAAYESEESREHAMMHLMAGAPDAVIDSDKTSVARAVSRFLSKVACVNTYSLSDDSSRILGSILLIFKTLLESDTSRSMMQPDIGPILGNLITIATSAYYSLSRRVALECLEKIGAVMPYQSIHQYRQDVIKASTRAADDLKRHVRFAAAACRQQWSL